MDGDLRLTADLVIPRSELAWHFSRAGGPGGQSVNTADSRVELRFDVAASTTLPDHLKRRALQRLAGRLVGGVLIIVASEHRSQLHNRRAALARLVDVVGEAVAPPAPTRRATKPARVRSRRDWMRRAATASASAADVPPASTPTSSHSWTSHQVTRGTSMRTVD